MVIEDLNVAGMLRNSTQRPKATAARTQRTHIRSQLR
jgi:hypothetical protein